MATTYKKLAEIIRDSYYKQIPNDEASYSVRFFAELVAAEYAKSAWESAIGNSNLGEATFANDQFISTYKNLPLLIDATTQQKYVTIPASIAGLPNNQELAWVTFVSHPKRQIVPMRSKDVFAQQMIGDPKCFDLCSIEGKKLIFHYISPLASGPVNMGLVGSVPDGNLMEAVLDISKDAEANIRRNILRDLLPQKREIPDVLNDGVSQA